MSSYATLDFVLVETHLLGSFIKENVEFASNVETDPVIVAVGI